MSLSDRIAQRLTPAAAPGEPSSGGARSARHVDPFAAVKRGVHARLLEALGPRLYDAHVDQRELELRVTEALQIVLRQEETPMTGIDRIRLANEILDDILGHGPLERLLEDETITEIMVNGPFDIWVEQGGRLREKRRTA